MNNLDSRRRVNNVKFKRPVKYLAIWLMIESRYIRLNAFLKSIFRRHLSVELEYISIKDITECTCAIIAIISHPPFTPTLNCVVENKTSSSFLTDVFIHLDTSLLKVSTTEMGLIIILLYLHLFCQWIKISAVIIYILLFCYFYLVESFHPIQELR